MPIFDERLAVAPEDHARLLEGLASRQRAAGVAPHDRVDGTPLVLDNGAGKLRVGFAKASAPSVVLELGDPRDHAGAGALWAEALRELDVDPGLCPTLMIIPSQASPAEREAATAIALTELGLPAVYLADSAALWLYAHGRLDGIVVELRGRVCVGVAIAGGYCVREAITSAPTIAEAVSGCAARLDPRARAQLLTRVHVVPDSMAGELDLAAIAEQLATATHEPATAELSASTLDDLGPWRAGAALAKVAAYRAHWITKAEFDATGPRAVHRRCF